MLVAIGAGAAVSASVGSLSLLLGAVIEGGEIPDVWRTWWLGDASGALIVLPLALAWARPHDRRLAAAARHRGGAAADRDRRALRARPARQRAAHLPRLPGPDLGRAAAGPARGDGGRGRGRRLRDLGDHAPHGAVRVPVDHLQHPQHPALHRGLVDLDALPRRRGRRAGGPGGAARRLPGAAGRGRRHRAAADRAQPPRRRAAAPDRHRRAAAPRGRPGARRPRRAVRRCSTRPRPSCSWRSTSCASSRTGSIPPSLTTLGLEKALDDGRRRDRRSRSGCWSCRRPGSTRPPRRPRTSSPARP